MIILSNAGWKSGLGDWILQRFTGIYIFLYSLFIIFHVVSHQFEYGTWGLLFQSFYFKLITILFVFSIALHASIGMGIILTDYIKQTYVRISLDFIINIILLSYVFCIMQILWSLK